MYTKKNLAKELIEMANNDFSVKKISDWAHLKYLDHARQMDNKTDDAIMTLITMDAGEEFELTKEEILEIANKLLNE